MAYSRVAVVTGGNKGIGLAIVRNLALEYPKSHLNNGKFLIYLTARNKERGEEALRNIHADSQLKDESALSGQGGLTDIKHQALDINDTNSINAFSKFLSSEHPEGIDIAVNNAGVALDGFNAEIVKNTFKCNYYGTMEATQTFLNHIRNGGRLVNVSSTVGKLGKYSNSARSSFLAASQQPTPDATTKVMESFVKAVEAGRESQEGWPSSAYKVSKSGCTSMTMAIAKGEEGKGRGILVNACCPGYVNTDMTKGRGVKTVDQGAKTPVMLALGDIGGQTGKFWHNEKVEIWE